MAKQDHPFYPDRDHHSDHELFLEGIAGRFKVRLTFFSKEDNGNLVRLCAPMDFGPSRRTADGHNRYHFWDYESDKKTHTLSLLANQIENIELLSENFEPAEFVTWPVISWYTSRDWAAYS